MRFLKISLTGLAASLVVAACTTVPEQIQGEYTELTPVRVDTASIGTEVRWGGEILSTEVRGDTTCLEVLSRRLDKYMRPTQEDYTAGRYIACKTGFQDPMVFTKGREVTTTGTIRNIEARDVDGFNYRYPVLEVDSLVLWEKRRNVIVYRGFNDPWHYRYPWGYPYWGYSPWGWGGSTGRAEMRTLTPDASIVESEQSTSADSRER